MRGYYTPRTHLETNLRDLRDEDEELRADAAYELGFIGDPLAASALRQVLRDDDETVRHDDAKATKRILDRARDLEIPLNPKNLTLTRTTAEMIISASYEQPIDFKVTTYLYKFDAKERAPLF